MRKIRVVLIDDHPIVRAGIKMLLEQDSGIEVVGESDNGNQAIELVLNLNPDVLILDMEIPGKKGPEVAQELKRMKSKVRILGLSAYDDAGYITSLLVNGAVGYLTKEEALDKIVDAVHGVARGETGWFSQRAMAQMANHIRQEQLEEKPEEPEKPAEPKEPEEPKEVPAEPKEVPTVPTLPIVSTTPQVQKPHQKRQILDHLTPREQEVLRALMKGETNKRMALDLEISVHTVRFHLSNIYEKLGVSSRGEAIAEASQYDF